MKIFVGNLAAATDEQDLLKAFQEFGKIDHVNIAKTSPDGQSRGFGFVDVSVEAEGLKAIVELNGTMIHGRKLQVKEARRKVHGD